LRFDTFEKMADVVAMHQENKNKLGQADQKLDILEKMTGTMVVKATDINTELKDQNQIIDQTNQKMDTANDGIVKVNSKLDTILEHKSSCISWIIVILEVIALVVIFII
jgi:septal ring factor EnvC (AmiA/AmiB activator)